MLLPLMRTDGEFHLTARTATNFLFSLRISKIISVAIVVLNTLFFQIVWFYACRKLSASSEEHILI